MDTELLIAVERFAATLGGALVTKPLVERLLGPSVEYIGSSIAELLRRYGNRNIADVFRIAARKSTLLTSGTSYVHPRVLRTVIEEGSYADDPITREYLGGLLASAIDGGEGDDRAVTLLSAVRNLTHQQIWLHHLFYSTLRQLYVNAAPDVSWRAFISYESLRTRSIDVMTPSSLEFSALALSSLALLAPAKAGAQPSSFSYFYASKTEQPGNGLLASGTHWGIYLFMWVHGVRDADPAQLFSSELPLRDWAPYPSNVALPGYAIDRHEYALRFTREAIERCEKRYHTFLRETLDNILKYGSDLLPKDVITAIKSTPSKISDRFKSEPLHRALRQAEVVLTHVDAPP